MDLLEELFYGRLDPGAKPPERGSALAKAQEQADRKEALLNETLTEEQKGMLSQISRANDDIAMLYELTGFKSGFCLGIRLVLAACFGHPGKE